MKEHRGDVLNLGLWGRVPPSSLVIAALTSGGTQAEYLL